MTAVSATVSLRRSNLEWYGLAAVSMHERVGVVRQAVQLLTRSVELTMPKYWER